MLENGSIRGSIELGTEKKVVGIWHQRQECESKRLREKENNEVVKIGPVENGKGYISLNG